MTTWTEDVFVVGSALKDCCYMTTWTDVFDVFVVGSALCLCCYMTTWTGDVFVVGSALCLEGLLLHDNMG